MPATKKKIEILTADQLRQRRDAARAAEEARLAKIREAELAKTRKPIMELYESVMEALGEFVKDKDNALESECMISIEGEPLFVIQGAMAELVKGGYSVCFNDDENTGAAIPADSKRSGHISLSW